ncbi:4-hydroxyphenylacetate 3-hydroxylase [Pseudonocardia sp. C8]|uniref:4-hydroxyphenylacetate 3-hydroxylase family protein n=1 Tax=Pseudonocardia sp. C8 TaxID=2762759 RepID=UPI001642FCC1|nr:4-hydroxyphenylacetate 3-hydroxylase N-terminal domain-containing protein [Pseudonocardia sp. C8]MBC3190366.1 4-hydroxyphenylacetate 3-hydroxylase [Pseudonocardia sp. C8]
MRTGKDYLSSLDDGRTVYLDGERIDDVTVHPAFAPVAGVVAELYDMAADPANGMQYTAPETGETANLVFSTPRDAEGLAARRAAIQRWAGHTHGWVGRSPDHVGTFLAGFASRPELFDTEHHSLGANVTAYYQRLLREDLFVSYAIIPPQVSRATTASGWGEDFLQAGVAEETAEGIVLRGAQMLATGAAVADEVLITCIKPLGPDDQDFAFSAVLPVNAEGLKLYCRRPFAPAATSAFDYPLTSRYDEPDALVVLDDVFVPWERVFASRDIAVVRDQFFGTCAHALGNWQAQIRFAAKLRFIAGIARKVTQVNGTDKIPAVADKLGELASIVGSVQASVDAAEFTATLDGNGVMVPGREPLYSAMGLQSETYPRVIGIVRDLVGGGVLQLPASVRDLTSEHTAADVAHYIQSPGVASEERIKLFKLAWDVIGSEFAGRHQQYEMFYAGAPFVVRGVYAFRNFGYQDAVEDVDAFLAGYTTAS